MAFQIGDGVLIISLCAYALKLTEPQIVATTKVKT